MNHERVVLHRATLFRYKRQFDPIDITDCQWYVTAVDGHEGGIMTEERRHAKVITVDFSQRQSESQTAPGNIVPVPDSMLLDVDFTHRQAESQTFPGIFVPDHIILDTATAYMREHTDLGRFILELHTREMFSEQIQLLAHFLLATVFPRPDHPISKSVQLSLTTLIDLHGIETVSREELLYWLTLSPKRKRRLRDISPLVLSKRCFKPQYFEGMEAGMWEILLCCVAACRMERENHD